MFGEYIKEKRLGKKLSLRQFCRLLDEDPSNWSKIERGLISPPQDDLKLNKIASILNFDVNSIEFKNIFDYARIDAGKIPDFIMSEKDILQTLPAFFRTVGSVKPKPEEIQNLIEIIKNGGQKIE